MRFNRERGRKINFKTLEKAKIEKERVNTNPTPRINYFGAWIPPGLISGWYLRALFLFLLFQVS
jgi:hypothetical protein